MNINVWGFIAILVACLFVGGLFSYYIAPGENIVEVEVPAECEVCPVCEVCPEPIVCENITEADCPDYDYEPYFYQEIAWNYIIDNWNEEDFDDELAWYSGDKYDLDEIDWELQTEPVTIKLDDEGYNVKFKVTGEYDNDGEATYTVTYDQYKNREPVVTIA